MKYCRRMARIAGWVSVFIMMPVGVLLPITGIWCLLDLYIFSAAFPIATGLFYIFFAAFAIATGLFFVWLGAIESSFQLRKYSITVEGFYPGKRKNAFYTWEQICEIGIFPFDAAASLEVYDRVICVFLTTPDENIKEKLFRNRRSYAQRNQDKFVIMDYDEKIMGVLSTVYPKDIVDHTVGMKGYIRNCGFRKQV